MKDATREQWKEMLDLLARCDERIGVRSTVSEPVEHKQEWWQEDGWSQPPRVCDLPDEDGEV